MIARTARVIWGLLQDHILSPDTDKHLLRIMRQVSLQCSELTLADGHDYQTAGGA